MHRSIVRRFPVLLLLIVLLAAVLGLPEAPLATGDEDNVLWLSSIERGLERSAELDRPIMMVFR